MNRMQLSALGRGVFALIYGLWEATAPASPMHLEWLVKYLKGLRLR